MRLLHQAPPPTAPLRHWPFSLPRPPIRPRPPRLPHPPLQTVRPAPLLPTAPSPPSIPRSVHFKALDLVSQHRLALRLASRASPTTRPLHRPSPLPAPLYHGLLKILQRPAPPPLSHHGLCAPTPLVPIRSIPSRPSAPPKLWRRSWCNALTRASLLIKPPPA